MAVDVVQGRIEIAEYVSKVDCSLWLWDLSLVIFAVTCYTWAIAR